MAENCGFRQCIPPRIAVSPRLSRSVLSRNEKARRRAADGPESGGWRGLGERRDTAREPREFPGGGVLVEDTLRNAAGQLGLDLLDRGQGLRLVAGLDRCLDLLDEGADAADAGAIDVRATRVTTDALLCLRRVRH